MCSLLVHGYPLPTGFTVGASDIALEIPPTYPQAQIYGFYAFPPLALANARAIPSTQLTGVINGKPFVGWSRYRPGQPWDPDGDNVVTQLALVEASLIKEAGECGCGDVIELPLIAEADQHWTLAVDRVGHPTLAPSVWRKTGCRSHFWLREGRVRWC